MALVVSADNHKTELGDVKPGNSVQLSWDSRITTYMVVKTETDFAKGKIPLVNLETGRLVFKPRVLLCAKVSATITLKECKAGNL